MGHGRRLGTYTYLWAYNLCVLRDGERCNHCGWEPGDAPTKIQKKKPIIPHNLQRLELDHIDGNTQNNPPDGSNHQLLCKTCNIVKGVEPEGEGEGESRDEVESALAAEKTSGTRYLIKQAEYSTGEASMKAKSIGEPIFRDYCITRVFREGQVEKVRLLKAGAELAGANWRKTCVYWLDNLTSDTGVLAEVDIDGTVYVVPRYVLQEEKKPKRGRPRKNG